MDDQLSRLAEAERRCRALELELQSANRVSAAGRALQAVVDDLELASNLDDLVPQALRFALEAFEAPAGLYFEHADDGLIYLRSACIDGQVLNTPFWPGADAEQARFIAVLFAGFQVDAELLGVDPVRRSVCAVQDHRTAAAWPEAHRWVLSMGWSVELNVPLVVKGKARGALSIFRKHPPAFSDHDIALAEALARQVAVAMQARRVAQQAHVLELAREREAAMAARLAEHSRVTGALQALTEVLASLQGPEDWMPRVLNVAAEAFAISEAGYFESIEGRSFLRIWMSQGRVFRPADVDARRSPAQAFLQSMIDGFETPAEYRVGTSGVAGTPVVVHHRSTASASALNAFAVSRGYDWELNMPLRVGGLAMAHLALYRPDGKPFTDEDRAVAEPMARLVGVGIEAARAAERAREGAVAQERSRLAADIHDSLAQSFTSIALQCEVLVSRLAPGSAEARTADLIERTARRGLAGARASVQALRALPEGDDALSDALAELAEHCTVRGSIDCRFEQRQGRCALSASVQETVLRVAQEAASNAMKHARCRTLRIHLDWDESEVILTVQDDGQGLPDEAAFRSGDGSGYGLPGMAQRAASLGGRCVVASAPGKGVTVTLRLPRGT